MGTSTRAQARVWGPPKATAASTLHSSVLQQDTGRVWPMPSTSEGSHVLAQDLVTVESPRKGYTAGGGRDPPQAWLQPRTHPGATILVLSASSAFCPLVGMPGTQGHPPLGLLPA